MTNRTKLPMQPIHSRARYDLVVVGAGPGGSATAILAAMSGLRVAVVERSAFPRDHCGETLHPGVEPLLAQLGVADAILAAGFLRHEGQWVQWGGPARFESFGGSHGNTGHGNTGHGNTGHGNTGHGNTGHGETWRGFQAWRATFDHILLERARGLGVDVLQPCRALEPLVTASGVGGVATAEGVLTAAFVIDASGAGHWLARRLKLSIEARSPRLIARCGYAEGECPLRDQAPAIVAGDGGWTWTARVQPRLYGWVRLAVGPALGSPGSALQEARRTGSVDLPDALSPDALSPDALPEELRGLHPRGRPRSADVTWRAVAPMAGPGYFLVGDAAAVLDPCSSHGVLKAMMSGMLAARLAAQVTSGQVGRDRAAQIYSHWLGRWFEHDVQKLHGLYKVFRS